jgi:uncharacterized protein (UPF0333 family)
MKSERAQGALEYMLLLGGILLVVVLATLLIRGTLSSGADTVNRTTATYQATQCFPGRPTTHANGTFYCYGTTPY